MSSDVIIKVAFRAKALGTVTTLVRLVIFMYPHVHLQISKFCEFPGAFFTFESLDPFVGINHMLRYVLLSSEPLQTYRAVILIVNVFNILGFLRLLLLIFQTLIFIDVLI